MAYGNKVKFHYDIPVYIKNQLVDMAKKSRITATEMLSNIIEEEYLRVTEQQKKKYD
ncbi:MAG: hypothetical protein WDZ91_15890 [Paenibacillaceae bacterium]